ncbi:hypothetical protein QBC37DRAFT_300890 [Rhypophila decipiens]|uniref:JmjC domain-containing protein n=1 Tax=Rhypophila decipiens TaxID=261697 RepID=A0AAN7B0H4_9PEZI|nr:hypothetical protein QBC37DRAFT_300890 [Rhypophila decipiens]
MAQRNFDAVDRIPTGDFVVSLLVLSLEQARLIDQFRARIRLCETDTERYELCTQTRDDVLRQETEGQLLADAYEHVIVKECIGYKEWKENKAETWTLLGKTGEDVTPWESFANVARRGSEVRSKCLGPLRTVSQHWGADFVQHYQLACKGAKYCEVTSAAAQKIPDRDEAVTKLNRLMLRKHMATGRGILNPIAQVDLVDLKAWSHLESFDKNQESLPYRKLSAADLPPGFGFDKFGLMVREEFAVSLLVDAVGDAVEAAAKPGADINRVFGPNDTDTVGASVLVPSDGTNPQVSDCNFFAEQASHFVPAHEELHELISEGASSIEHHAHAADASSDCSRSTAPTSSPPEAPGSREAVESARNAGCDMHPATRLRGRSGMPDYHETPPKRLKATIRHPELLSSARLPERCCPPKIPAMLLGFLDKMDGAEARQIPTFILAGVPLHDMCYTHLKKYTEAITTTTKSFGLFPKSDNFQTANPGIIRRRRASLPELIDPPPLKRLRSDDQSAPGVSHLATSSLDGRPKHDPIRDEAYRRQVLSEFDSTVYEPDSWGNQTNILVSEILSKSTPPTDAEAYFLSGEEASQRVEFGSVESPIFTQGQQRFQWKGNDRPILQFFHHMEDLGLDRAVSVQVPSRSSFEASSERKTLSQVRKRFLSQQSTTDPWNLLDLQGSLPSTLPAFLDGDNCQLLIRIRDAILMGNDAQRISASREDWNTWRNVLKWTLLSEGGNNTAPHMDSHGYSTCITIQEGNIGFGWMSRPSQQEEDEWIADPHSYTGGRWRYVILSPGHTVFFPSGTIHFVFRLQGVQTFALGGHVLQWSSIERWLKVIIAQLKNPDITNEDMTWSAPKLVQAVERLIANRVKAHRMEEMGGRDAVARISALRKVSS